MRNFLLVCIALAAGQVSAAGFDEAARLGQQAALKAGQLGPRIAARSRVLSGKTTSSDLSILFDLGAKPEAADITGWYSGRRFTDTGPAAALLVGGEMYDNPNSGPIGGKSFKVVIFGGDSAGISPADLYDEPGSHTIDTVQYLLTEKGKDWTPVRFDAKSALMEKNGEAFELRKWGRYLICKYPTGYGYFFKKLTPVAGASSGLKSAKETQELPATTPSTDAPVAPAPNTISPLPGSEELSAKFEAGTLPSEGALSGWFAGRRFTTGGPVAALMVGVELYDNPQVGPIDGSVFKLVVMGPDKPGIVPVELYDLAGSAMVNGVAWNLRELLPKWSTTRADSGVVTTTGERSYEVRQAGDFLVIRYPEGFGYFFKRIR